MLAFVQFSLCVMVTFSSPRSHEQIESRGKEPGELAAHRSYFCKIRWFLFIVTSRPTKRKQKCSLRLSAMRAHNLRKDVTS